MSAFVRHSTLVISTRQWSTTLTMFHSSSQGPPALEGAEAVRAYYENVFKAGQVSATMDTKRVEETGDLLLEHGEYTMSVQPKGSEAISDTGKYSLVLRRDEQGSWCCWFDVFQSDGKN